MTTVVAVRSIRTSDPLEPLTFSGRYDKTGAAVMTKRCFNVPPGAFHEIEDPADLERLLELRAVRLPTPAEAALRRVTQGDRIDG